MQIRKRAQAQRNAIGEFQKTIEIFPPEFDMPVSSKAFFAYDYQMEAYDTLRNGMLTSQPSPHWLAGLLGVDFVHNVELVDFDLPANAEMINRLRDLPGLKTVIVDSGFADQSAWNALVRCRQLEKLHYAVSASLPVRESVPIKFQNLASLAHLNEFQIQSARLWSSCRKSLL